MAVRREIHIEDIVLGLTVLFTFLYPLIITAIILYQEAKKEEKALNRFEKIINTLTGEDCREEIFEVAPYTDISPKELVSLCRFTEGKKVKEFELKREGDELIYRARVNGGYLTLVGVWELNRFRIIFIGYDKGS